MISRRNIRIKVFQTIYEMEQQEDKILEPVALNYLDQKIIQSSALLASVCHLLFLITDYVLVYSNQKASKRIATQEDLNVNVKLAGNLLMQKLKSNTSFAEVVKKHKIAHLFDEDLIKSLFLILIETPEYKSYILEPERTAQGEKKILEVILDQCILKNEDAVSFLSGQYINWYTDDEMLSAWTGKVLLTASNFNFNQIISPEKHQFAKELLICYFDKKETVFQLIEPKLINWDAERVAMIDLILLHLGICELLYFPNIPVKVSINEYIDLAKSFSTLQSGQFVNGILDNVRKELEKENKIIKTSLTSKS